MMVFISNALLLLRLWLVSLPLFCHALSAQGTLPARRGRFATAEPCPAFGSLRLRDPPSRSPRRRDHRPPQPATSLSMGLFDGISSFLGKREGDFVKLESTDDAYGPGPALLLYGCPPGITDDEIADMISDGAPRAFRSGRGVTVRRIDVANDAEFLDRTVRDALEGAVRGGAADAAAPPRPNGGASPPCPVLYFSGFTNEEMMGTYRIIAQEIYEETGGMASAACAKAVPPAMGKTMRQVLEEITGDHLDAISDNNSK